MEQLLVKQEYRLQKFPGKGGWTYAVIPEIYPSRHLPFGWVRVKGTIDSYAFDKYHLMPMKNGQLFFPVKAEVRKKIKKEAGDMVMIVLYADHSKFELPKEVEECLKNEPDAYSKFLGLKEREQQEFIDWIYSAKREETKVERIVIMIDKLLKGTSLRTK